MTARKPYPSDVSDEEWALVAPYLTLLPEDVGQREHSLREVFNGLRYVVKTGPPWRWMPNDLHLGRLSTSRRNAGWRQGASRRWPRIPPDCGRSLEGRHSPLCYPGQQDLALYAGTQRAGGLRRCQVKEGLQAAPGARHTGASAGVARHACQCRRSRRGWALPRRCNPPQARASIWPMSTRGTPAGKQPMP